MYNIESQTARPEQLLRFRDNRTIGAFAAFTYQSPGPTGLAEDDAYMAPIIALGKMLNFDNIFSIPLHMWTVDIAWEYGVVYPMAVYDEQNADNAELQVNQFFCCNFLTASQFPLVTNYTMSQGHIALVLNQRRCSMMLYAQTTESADAESALSVQDIREQDFRPTMQLLVEFTPTKQGGDKIVYCKSFFDCQKKLFHTGVGPVPFVRRPGKNIAQLVLRLVLHEGLHLT